MIARDDIRVLIADDHAVMRRSLRKLLEDSGVILVGEAADGEQAVRLCERLAPDIVVLDIAMPTLNGFEAARLIGETCPATKIIFLTGYDLDIVADQAFQLGADAFVAKKHAASRLLPAIEAVLEGKIYDSRSAAA